MPFRSSKGESPPRSKPAGAPRIAERAWGIDAGQRSLKALQVGLAADSGEVFALAYDLVAYPPGLEKEAPADRVAAALRVFADRNAVGDDLVAVSALDQTGLIHYGAIPPIDDKRLPDLVEYEAKLAIPVPLGEVAWDYQRFVREEPEREGEVPMDLLCLAALKLDRLDATLLPFDEAGIVVDVVQLRSIALANAVDFEAPPAPDAGALAVLLDVGCKTTEVTVVDMPKVWQRTVAVGGDHFTAAVAEEFKLSSSKAEHLKQNPSHAADTRGLFLAMRPAFRAFVQEVGRGIRLSVGPDRKFHIALLGGGSRLLGLENYLRTKLEVPVGGLGGFSRMNCDAIAEQPLFRANRSAFAVPAGLGLQALEIGLLTPNLLPPEMRPVRAPRGRSWFGR